MKLTGKMRKLAIACGITAAVLILAVLLVPWIARKEAVKWVATHTSRTLTVEAIRFNPLSLAITIRGVSLSEPHDPVTPFVAFDRLEAGLSLRSLWDRAMILRKLRLEGPRVRLVRSGANAYNFADLQALGKGAPPAAAEEKEPLHFSVNNIRLVNGRVDFIDRVPAQEQHHAVSELNIGIPFVGNIPYLTDLYVTPSFSARINDAPLHFSGKLKPFKDGAETVIELSLDAFDLARYAPYLPAELPLRIAGGRFDSKVEISYRVTREERPEIGLAGRLHLAHLATTTADGAPLLGVRDLAVELHPSRPLAGDLHFKAIAVAGVDLNVRRDRDGGWNLPGLHPAAAAAPPQGGAAPPPPKTHAARLRIASLQLRDSTLAFADERPTGGFATRLRDLAVEIAGLDSTSAEPATVKVSFAGDRGEVATLAGSVALRPVRLNVRVDLGPLPLAAYHPYLQSYLTAPLGGTLSLGGALRYTTEEGATLRDGSLLLAGLHLPFGPKEGFTLPRLAANGLQAQLREKNFVLEELLLDGGRGELTRLRDGSWSPLALLRPRAPVASAGPAAATAAPERPPRFALNRLRLDDWRVRFRDETVDATLPLTAIAVTLDRFAYPALTLERAAGSFRLAGGRCRLETGGRLAPLDLAGRLVLQQFPLAPFWPYVPPQVRVLLVNGDLDGDLRYRFARGEGAPAGFCRGALGLGNLYLVNADDADDLLRWEHLRFAGIDLNLDRSRLAVQEVALSGLVSKLTIAGDGSLNLGKVVTKPEQVPETTSAAAAPAPAAPPQPPPRDWAVAVDRVTLQNGRIDFTDRHMSPPFHAELLNLGGRISGLSSAPGMQAEVDLRGNLENRSPLQISGTMNPLSRAPRLDLKVAFNDIELSPATPYTSRYLGYTVDKGKLFLDLHYRVEEKALAAANRIFIDQFTFGERVESPDATSLPVKLAVALLKDRNGEIRLDVPVSGRTDDPEFSIFRIVLQVLKNLLVKAATSPFALLASLGGGEDFSAVIFTPGSARLDDGARQSLARLATVLADRPALKLQLTGYAEAAVDAEPYRRELLEQKLKRAKFLELARDKAVAAGATAESVTLAAAERPRYLREVYRREDFPKPRNALGLVKELPAEEMEKLLLSHTVVGPAELTALAWARSAAVRNALVAENALPAERLFQNNVEIVRPKEQGDDWRGNRLEFGVATE